MRVNILIVGSDSRGSWQMRGVQLGRVLGARVTLTPTAADWKWADVVVLVKRAAIQWAKESSRVCVPVVWDVLDFWDQPEDNALPLSVLTTRVKEIQQLAGVSMLIGATKAMADDIGGRYLTHHCHIDLTPTPTRLIARSAGYDGTKKYLGRWAKALQHSCESLGLTFVVNPTDVRDVDVLVSFRDGQWDGDICRRWKSGVKHVNALVAGRPILSHASAAQDELMPIGAVVESVDRLTDALSLVVSEEVRQAAYRTALRWQADFQVDAVAHRYLDMLTHAPRRAA